MRRALFTLHASIASLGVLGGAAVAQAPAQPPAQTPAGAAASAPERGYRAEFLREMQVTEDHYLALAERIPAALYTWRPAAGVRSVSEVFLHVAAANFNLPRRLGAAPPAGFRVQGYETATTDKAQVIEALRQSFAHLRSAVNAVSDADADKAMPWFGGENTYRGLLLFITRHSGEHLGQAIAYARVNGVVPPWSEEQQQARPPQQTPQPQPPQPRRNP